MTAEPGRFPWYSTHRRPPFTTAADQRLIVNGILWILHTGAPWRDLPERYGPWKTVFHRFNSWRKDGTWVRIVTSLLDELDDKGLIDHDLWSIDGTVINKYPGLIDSAIASGVRFQYILTFS